MKIAKTKLKVNSKILLKIAKTKLTVNFKILLIVAKTKLTVKLQKFQKNLKFSMKKTLRPKDYLRKNIQSKLWKSEVRKKEIYLK